MRLSQHFYRARREFVATSGRAVGLSKDANHLMLRSKQRVEMTRCEVRSTGKDDF
ncbi:hypothetical protein QE407_002214 [Pantoea dispersa]|nr:hypothetical protein [Pantoea dispersa]